MLTNEAFSLTLETAGGGTLLDGEDIYLGTSLENVSGATLASALQAVIQAADSSAASATTITFS